MPKPPTCRVSSKLGAQASRLLCPDAEATDLPGQPYSGLLANLPLSRRDDKLCLQDIRARHSRELQIAGDERVEIAAQGSEEPSQPLPRTADGDAGALRPLAAVPLDVHALRLTDPFQVQEQLGDTVRGGRRRPPSLRFLLEAPDLLPEQRPGVVRS